MFMLTCCWIKIYYIGIFFQPCKYSEPCPWPLSTWENLPKKKQKASIPNLLWLLRNPLEQIILTTSSTLTWELVGRLSLRYLPVRKNKWRNSSLTHCQISQLLFRAKKQLPLPSYPGQLFRESKAKVPISGHFEVKKIVTTPKSL